MLMAVGLYRSPYSPIPFFIFVTCLSRTPTTRLAEWGLYSWDIRLWLTLLLLLIDLMLSDLYGNHGFYEMAFMSYLGFVTIRSYCFWKGRSLAGGSKLILSVGFRGNTLGWIFVLSRIPVFVTIPKVCLVVPTGHLYFKSFISGEGGLWSLWTSMFYTGSFFTNSKKPPWGLIPLFA
jgi:hypothetical protein